MLLLNCSKVCIFWWQLQAKLVIFFHNMTLYRTLVSNSYFFKADQTPLPRQMSSLKFFLQKERLKILVENNYRNDFQWEEAVRDKVVIGVWSVLYCNIGKAILPNTYYSLYEYCHILTHYSQLLSLFFLPTITASVCLVVIIMNN